MFYFFRTLKAPMMSTHLEIKGRIPKKLLLQAYELAKSYEQTLSAYNPRSEISHINAHAGIKSVKISAHTHELLALSLKVAALTQGSFDPTIGALSHSGYGFGGTERLLSAKEAKSYQALVDYKKLILKEQSAFLEQKGMRLDLGGIAKGYTVDKMMQLLRAHGVKQALISLGGEIACVGKRWRLGIGHPRREGLARLIKSDKALTAMTSSGDYERHLGSFESHHILDPKTAQSANRFSSVTLVSKSQSVAMLDALNTALFSNEELYDKLGSWDIKRLSMDKSGTIIQNEIGGYDV